MLTVLLDNTVINLTIRQQVWGQVMYAVTFKHATLSYHLSHQQAVKLFKNMKRLL